MYDNPKLNIYQGIIQYLLDTTNYNLKRIAYLSNSSINQIRTIFSSDEIPGNFTSELDLLRLYQMVIEQQKKTPGFASTNTMALNNNVIS